MKQKIRYRITTNMGVWLAYTRSPDTESTQANEYHATRAYPTNGKYSPLTMTMFRCEHIVEYLPRPLTIEVQDAVDHNAKRTA